MNLPNKITLTRIILVPFFVAAYTLEFLGDYWIYIATGIFALASLTDKLDGSIARKRNIVTDLGKFMDPIADKVLGGAALFIVIGYGLLAPITTAYAAVGVIIVTIMVGRDFAVSALRTIAARKGIVIAADALGKIKMVLQVAAFLVLLPAKPLDAVVGIDVFTIIGFVLLVTAALVTLVSGVNYIVRNRGVFKEEMTNDE